MKKVTKIDFDEKSQELITMSRLWEEGKKEEAYAMVMKMLSQDPDNPILNITAGEYLNYFGKIKESDVYIQKAIENEPENIMNPWIHIQKAVILAERGLIHDAVSLVEDTIKKPIHNFMTIQAAASMFKDYGLLQEAEKAYLRGIEAMPKHEQFWKDYAEMYKKAGLMDKFLEVLQKGVEERKRDTHLWSELCRTAAYLGKRELAFDALENTKKFIKDSLLDYVRMGLAYAALGDYDKAKEFMEKAVNLDKKNQISWVYFAQILMLKGDKKGAENAFKAAEKADKSKKDLIKAFRQISLIKSVEFSMSQNAEPIFNDFISAFKANEEMPQLVTRIVKVYHVANADWLINKSLDYVKDEKMQPGTMNIIALTLHALKESKKSIGAMHYGIKRFEENSVFWNNLSSILLDMKKMYGLHAAWKKLLSIESSNESVRKNLGLLSVQLNFFEDAIKYLDDTSDEFQVLYGLGMSHIFTGGFEKAKELALRMMEMEGNQSSAYGTLALAEAGLGNNDASDEALEKCKKIDKNAAKEFERILAQASSG